MNFVFALFYLIGVIAIFVGLFLSFFAEEEDKVLASLNKMESELKAMSDEELFRLAASFSLDAAAFASLERAILKQSGPNILKLYVDSVSLQHELDQPDIKFYTSVEHMKKHCPNWERTGITELTIDLDKVLITFAEQQRLG